MTRLSFLSDIINAARNHPLVSVGSAAIGVFYLGICAAPTYNKIIGNQTFTASEIKENFIDREDVATNYIGRNDLLAKYVSKDSFDELNLKISKIQEENDELLKNHNLLTSTLSDERQQRMLAESKSTERSAACSNIWNQIQATKLTEEQIASQIEANMRAFAWITDANGTRIYPQQKLERDELLRRSEQTQSKLSQLHAQYTNCVN
ncbi:hypothetical protein [Xanthomonas arboricola]|uniref:hypothetical protein n=1 Tax=Xanthomonas arboricola TaxID=56448 RepID=UPI0012D360BD|nr:hypothetical protein [Xanthomonas arboricola]